MRFPAHLLSRVAGVLRRFQFGYERRDLSVKMVACRSDTPRKLF